jgi:hypothetical protein
MKYKIVLLFSIFFSLSTITAQTEEILSQQLNWKGVDKWYSGSNHINVISFDEAQYPTNNHLPYFDKRIICDQAFSYHVEVRNEVYISLTNDESTVLDGNTISSKIDILTDILHQRGTNYLDIRLLPFINQNGKIMKLQSFDLVIKKSAQPQKSVSVSPLHIFATSSVLAQGRFVKIKIANTGVYKLTYDDLKSMGVTPENVRIFGYGGNMLDQSFLTPKIDDLPEVAIWKSRTDGTFNSGDYILFYAQGVNKWTYDKSKLLFTHTVNTYSNYGYYFVTSDAGIGKKIEPKSVSLPNNPTIVPVTEFTDYQVHEIDKFNFIESGKEFYGETFNDNTPLSIPFSFPNPVLTGSTTVRLDVATISTAASNFSLSLNNSQNRILTVPAKSSDNFEKATGTSGILTFTPQNDALNFNLSYMKSTTTSVGYLNYLEVNTRRYLKMAGSVMQFQNIDNLAASTYNRYKLSAASSQVQIWDITDPANINSMQTQRTTTGDTLTFVAPSDIVYQYLAIDPTDASTYPKPIIENVVPNQNLHALEAVDLVILTYPDFQTQAEALAKVHREKDNLTVAVVTTDQVYNEFSSGTPDATAYRWVMKMLYDKALAANNPKDLPKYLLLFGRGSYDNRKLVPNSGDNLILTYQSENSLYLTQSYVTDDYFALLEDNDGTNIPGNLMDIGIGRFPVTNQTQATNVTNKVINYINNQEKGNWKNQLCFVADDGDAALHMTQADATASSIAQKYPAFQVNKIYLDAFVQETSASGQSYPVAKSKLQNLLASGLFLLNYTGHANANGWANEQILTTNDIKSLSNNHLPFIYAATCEFLQFDVQTISGGEQTLLNPAGGGIGIIAAALPVYASQNVTLDKLFCENLFKKQNGEYPRIGDVLLYAKNAVGFDNGNKLSYIYMGDPALRLAYPTKYNIITTNVNEGTTLGNDTLRALSVANIKGIIADASGNKVDNFNGTIHIVVYDKVQQITTLNNEHDGALTYSDRPNTLFSGEAAVTNGSYSFSFMLPKDIKYNYGSGRIDYYAEDDTNDNEAQGYFENFLIGGTSSNINNDTIGPNVNLYLNSTNFVSGDKVNETPLFIANISDIDGINMVGSGIGHDLMLTIDQDPSQSYIINDYFLAKTDSYTDGAVKYKLPEMPNGKHTLTFRAWDLLNNSTTNTVDFEVVKGLTPEIFSVYNYPNPVKTTGITKIVVNHDRPETILNTTVEIFDISGRKIWSKSQSNADNITWNLVTDTGNAAKTGIYFYRVNIKTANSDIFSKTNKMLVIEQ